MYSINTVSRFAVTVANFHCYITMLWEETLFIADDEGRRVRLHEEGEALFQLPVAIGPRSRIPTRSTQYHGWSAAPGRCFHSVGYPSLGVTADDFCWKFWCCCYYCRRTGVSLCRCNVVRIEQENGIELCDVMHTFWNWAKLLPLFFLDSRFTSLEMLPRCWNTRTRHALGFLAARGLKFPYKSLRGSKMIWLSNKFHSYFFASLSSSLEKLVSVVFFFYRWKHLTIWLIFFPSSLIKNTQAALNTYRLFFCLKILLLHAMRHQVEWFNLICTHL